jgi:hypothetical protein
MTYMVTYVSCQTKKLTDEFDLCGSLVRGHRLDPGKPDRYGRDDS